MSIYNCTSIQLQYDVTYINNAQLRGDSEHDALEIDVIGIDDEVFVVSDTWCTELPLKIKGDSVDLWIRLIDIL